jgi:hypothetical protein
MSPWTFRVPDTLRNFKGNNNAVLPKQFQKPLPGNKQGNTILLRQDRMCVVPNMDEIAKIPNAWPEVTVPFTPQYHAIPNPALPKNQPKIPGNSLGSQIK